MPNHTGNLAATINTGQMLKPCSYSLPRELVCLQVIKVIDQVSIRDCLIRDVILTPQAGACRSKFVYVKAGDYNIIEVKVSEKTDSCTKPGYKNLRLHVRIRYNIFYSVGAKLLKQPDEVTFNLTVNNIYCPDCSFMGGVICYPHDCSYSSNEALDEGGLTVKVEALIEAINEMLCSCTGALILQIGAFFVVKCVCNTQLLVPSYGYCPVPAEQKNSPANNCTAFNDQNKAPFLSCFFPEQELNPSDLK
ncbi:MAG: hypothetical protein GX660_08870 [Clostridiaceae bacterium]|nr:hypothetical protein [Clostridiaceae bacterium]